MTTPLTTALNDLTTKIMHLAHEMHANLTFEAELAKVKKNDVVGKICKLVELIAALNGDVCNGIKTPRKQAIEMLLSELDKLNKVIQSSPKLSVTEKANLNRFINANVTSIENVLTLTFPSA